MKWIHTSFSLTGVIRWLRPQVMLFRRQGVPLGTGATGRMARVRVANMEKVVTR